MLRLGAYLRASALTAVAVAAVPTLLFALGWWDWNFPEWHSQGDSGVAQGYAILAAMVALAEFNATIGYSLSHLILGRCRVTLWRFLIMSIGTLLATTAIAVTCIPTYLGAPAPSSPADFVIFYSGVVALLTLPFAGLWLRTFRRASSG
jgi:hypothetical protein